MYHSESGGCCDCGDRAAWKESGFCSIHQRLHVQEARVKDELLRATHDAVRHVLKELLAWVKKLHDKLSNSCEPETEVDMTMAMIYLDWSLKICAVDALRSIVCKDIIDYKIIYQVDSSTSPLDILLDCLGWMPERIIEAETTLFLQLLYKNEFKIQFLNILKGKYEKMIILAVNNEAYMRNYKYLDTNLDRVMVQLFNDPEMTTRLVHDNNLLELFIGVFHRVISCSAEE
jgi:E3 ubiquitin-protein ligase UBR1/E3 ubiquitin-protein ligase UBR3